MAAALGDLLQVTDFQKQASQVVLNIYYYRVTSLTGFTFDGYDDVLDWFDTNVMDVVRTAQSDALEHTGLEVKNLTNAIDFVTRPFTAGSVMGLVASQALPSYVTYTFRMLRESLATRNGYKRFAGVPESAGENNGYTPGSTIIGNIVNALKADIVIGLATLAEPVIVHRPIPIPATGYTYASIGGADFRGIGSQLTRKPGSGL